MCDRARARALGPARWAAPVASWPRIISHLSPHPAPILQVLARGGRKASAVTATRAKIAPLRRAAWAPLTPTADATTGVRTGGDLFGKTYSFAHDPAWGYPSAAGARHGYTEFVELGLRRALPPAGPPPPQASP